MGLNSLMEVYMEIIESIYKKYNNHIYFKPAFPLVFMMLYLFYYFTMISPVYSLSDRIAEMVNPYVTMPYITAIVMTFISLMYGGMLLRSIYIIMYMFAVGFSVYMTLKTGGNAYIALYIPNLIILVLNITIWVAFEKYKNNK